MSNTKNEVTETNVSETVNAESTKSTKSQSKRATTNKSTTVKSPEPEVSETSSKEDNKKTVKSKTTINAKISHVFITKPSYVYMCKSLSSPILGSTFGKCILREESENWLKVSCNASGKGRVDGYLSKYSTPFTRC